MSGTRDRSLDLFKGLLVLLMTWCHFIQFFGAVDLFPIARDIEIVINLLVFPGFVFAFGVATALSFYSKPFSAAAPRMVLSALKSLGAFYLSGIAFRVLYEGKPFSFGTVQRILLLQDLPGWSEFLASFAALALMALFLYWPLKRLRDKPLWLLFLSLCCLALCYLPYERIRHPLLRLFFGTTVYASFPPFQYFLYFLAGLSYVHLRERGWWYLLLVAVFFTCAGLLRCQALGHLPSRFPPDWGWIVLPAAGLALLMALSRGLDLLVRGIGQLQARRMIADPDAPLLDIQAALSRRLIARLKGWLCRLEPLYLLSHLGRNSLYYLLAGNLTLFTLASHDARPVLRFKAPGLFGQPISAPTGSLWWTVAFLLSASFVASLIRRAPKKNSRLPDSTSIDRKQ